MSDLKDGKLIWLIEQSHNAYLTWIALWLACMLGILTILTTITSNPNILTSVSHLFLFLFVYLGLVSGTIFSVVRLINIVKLGVVWVNQIRDKALKKELKHMRGKLSKLAVRDNETIRELNRFLLVTAHVGVALGLFLLPSFHYMDVGVSNMALSQSLTILGLFLEFISVLLVTKEVFLKIPGSYQELYKDWLNQQMGSLEKKLKKKAEEERVAKIKASIALLCLIIGMALQGVAVLWAS